MKSFRSVCALSLACSIAACAQSTPASAPIDLSVPDLTADLSGFDGGGALDGSPVDLFSADLVGITCVSDADCLVPDAGTATSCCNGQCVDTRASAQSCGTCGHSCGGAAPDCCNGSCTNLTTDTANCGTCGTACSSTNGAPSCSAKSCSWQCQAGFAHCQPGNTGCETSTTTALNCGACNNACNTANAANVSCNGTACSYVCQGGFADCVTTAPNLGGCSTNLAGTAQKLCGSVCAPQSSCCASSECTSPPGPAACYQTGVCSGTGGTCSYALKGTAVACGASCCNALNGTCSASCALTCTSGFADCNGDPSDGCEVNLNATSQKLCGGRCVAQASCCSVADCTAEPTPTACHSSACSGVGGTCSYPQTSGSQVCGATCCLPINGSCNSGSCTLACSSGFCDLDGNRTNGCEARANTTSNCATCGTACNTSASTGASCNGTTCLYTGCSSGHSDCNSAAPDADGCECATPGCCGTGCQVTHSDGLGEHFYDCTALSTFTEAEALAACTAHTGDASKCEAYDCVPKSGGATTDGLICDGDGAVCNCWDFSEDGHVGTAAGSVDTACNCPSKGTTPTWN